MIQPAANRDLPSPWFAWRMSAYFAALFLIYGIHVSYFPVWLSWRGLEPEQIGIITALPILIRVALTPMLAAYADAHRNHRDVIIALSCTAAAFVVAVMGAASFWAILGAAIPYAIATSTVMPLTETIAVSGVQTAGHDYGRMRLWGSLAFLAATVATGYLSDVMGAPVIIQALLVASLVTAAASWLLPKPVAPPSAPTGHAPNETERGLVLALLKQPVFVAFLLAVGAIMSSHAAFYTFGAIHLHGQGVSGQAFGILWAVSIVAEIVVLAFSAEVLARLDPLRLLMMAGCAGIVRWGAMSQDPPYAAILLLQALHGATYGAAHLGAIHFIARAVPGRGAGTAQALYSSISHGLFTALATLAAGHVYPGLAGRTFLVMAALCGIGVGAAIWLLKTWDGQPLIEAGVRPTPTAPNLVEQ